MDPRDTPGYRTHQALSNLDSIDIESLDPDDRDRIDAATTLLEHVSFLTRPGSTKKASTQ